MNKLNFSQLDKPILIATSNPSKITMFQEILAGIPTITLNDLKITTDVNENGITPLANAKIKAQFYSQYHEYVLTHDSGLYFEELDENDPLQPGVHIRRPNGKERLNDQEMISYYSSLIHRLGGKVHAYYQDAVVLKIGNQLENLIIKGKTFLMVDHPLHDYQPGWPLDSLYANEKTIKESDVYYSFNIKVKQFLLEIEKGELYD